MRADLINSQERLTIEYFRLINMHEKMYITFGIDGTCDILFNTISLILQTFQEFKNGQIYRENK